MLPHAFEQLENWKSERTRAGHMLLALDFDGTLAPIVRKPQEAALPPEARLALEGIARRSDTEVALISGRSLEDLTARAALAGAYYAGNHGLQIEGPGVHEVRAEAVALKPRVRVCREQLERELGAIKGVYVEDKELSLSVHYRLVDSEAESARVREIVHDVWQRHPDGLRLTFGKAIVEVRPDVDWHKGKALLFLLDSIRAARGNGRFALFVGDDRTDEDGFAVVRSTGAGVLVAPEPHDDTEATAYVRSPAEVVQLLERLA